MSDDQTKVMEYLQQYNSLFNKMAKQSFEKMASNDDVQQYSLPDSDKILSSFSQGVNLDPAIYFQEHMSYMEKHAQLLQAATKSMSDDGFEEIADTGTKDRRFKDQDWFENPFFNYVRQSYLINADFFKKVVDSLEFADPKAKQQASFLTRQYINSLSPANYVLTNPEVCREIIESEGKSIVKGMDKFFQDLESSPTEAFKLNHADKDSFTIGKDLATTPGSVIFKNDLIELIQYKPTTKQVFETPLLIIPPVINKFYILDLDEEKSMVKWFSEQGFTVFIISWVNPESDYAKKGVDDYITEGIVGAIDTIIDKTGAEKVHAAGYCIGGTLLATAQSYMIKKGQDKLASATFLTALFDFTEPGEVGNYLSEQTFSYIQKSANQKGFFDGRIMSMSFSLLRENNLFWSFFIENYLKGKDQTPFDILYWNSDSTNIPARCFIEFVKQSYVDNDFAKSNVVQINGQGIDMADITIPTYCLAAQSDHIVLWQSAFQSSKLLKGDTRFVLSGSGHVAGVINPAPNGKYPHWVGDENNADAEQWLASATEVPGSWWNDWLAWLAPQSGKKRAARRVVTKGYPEIVPAPGEYVKRRLD